MRYLLISFLMLGMVQSAFAEAFFSISKVKIFEEQPKKGGMFAKEPPKDAAGKPIPKAKLIHVFVPFVQATISAKDQIKTSDGVYARIYYYDAEGKPIGKPVSSRLLSAENARLSGLPVFMKGNEKIELGFPIPKEVLNQRGWKYLIVFGDAQEAGVSASPGLNWRFVDFAEKAIVEGKGAPREKRKTPMNPLVEYVVKTGNERQPQITLFMRPPPGMTDASEAKGILALCLLADSVEAMKRKLQGSDKDAETEAILRFAADEKLIVICWGSRGLWDPTKNWDEYSKAAAKATDETFDEVAEAWAKGVEELGEEYGFEPKNILLKGSSGSAQYAFRLALRQPKYFLAVHGHIPSSFDKPTPEARRILWCLTTGELESGYQRSLRFYHECRQHGYPMIYKAIIGLGHEWHPNSEAIGMNFFKYALTKAEDRDRYEKVINDPFQRLKVDQIYPPGQPWVPEFRTPPFVGDVINQEMYPLAQTDMIPTGFRVCLPTETIAKAWSHK